MDGPFVKYLCSTLHCTTTTFLYQHCNSGWIHMKMNLQCDLMTCRETCQDPHRPGLHCTVSTFTGLWACIQRKRNLSLVNAGHLLPVCVSLLTPRCWLYPSDVPSGRNNLCIKSKQDDLSESVTSTISSDHLTLPGLSHSTPGYLISHVSLNTHILT